MMMIVTMMIMIVSILMKMMMMMMMMMMDDHDNNNNYNNDNNSNDNLIERRNWRFSQSRPCTISVPQTVFNAHDGAQSRANHVQHIKRLSRETSCLLRCTKRQLSCYVWQRINGI